MGARGRSRRRRLRGSRQWTIGRGEPRSARERAAPFRFRYAWARQAVLRMVTHRIVDDREVILIGRERGCGEERGRDGLVTLETTPEDREDDQLERLHGQEYTRVASPAGSGGLCPAVLPASGLRSGAKIFRRPAKSGPLCPTLASQPGRSAVESRGPFIRIDKVRGGSRIALPRFRVDRRWGVGAQLTMSAKRRPVCSAHPMRRAERASIERRARARRPCLSLHLRACRGNCLREDACSRT